MTLTFGVTKNPSGYQAECLNFPLITACGWTREQLLDSILDHTQVYLDEVLTADLSELDDNIDNEMFCCVIKLNIDPESKLLTFEQIPDNL